MKLFSVRDIKAGVYHKPFFLNNITDAIRSFEVAVNSPETQFHLFPQDFELLGLADFNELTGELNVLENPERIAHALDVKRKPEPAPLFNQQ